MKNFEWFSFKVAYGVLSEIWRYLALTGHPVIAEYMEEAALMTGSYKNVGGKASENLTIYSS